MLSWLGNISYRKPPYIPRSDFFSPLLIYPFFISLFLLFGVFGLDIFSFSLFVLFLVSYVAGFLLTRRYSGKTGGGFPQIWRFGVPLIAVGIVAEIINIIFINTIPLLDLGMRSKMIPGLTYVSFLILPGCVIKSGNELRKGRPRNALAWFLLSLFAISLLGYKTEIIALLFSMALMLNYLGYLKRLEKAMGFVFLGMLGLFAVSGLTALRFSLTTGVFSNIISKVGIFGVTNGMMFQSIFSSLGLIPGPSWGPRGVISQMVGMGNVTTTPSVLGIPYLDFGIIGVIAMGLFLGFLFSSGYKALKQGNPDILPFHAVCLSFLILTIETGIADLIVILYFFIYLLMIICFWRLK